MKPNDRIHVALFGVERDRIVRPAVERDADRLVLLDHLGEPVPTRPDRETLADVLGDHGIGYEHRDVSFSNVFDVLAAVGRTIADYGDDDVSVNLSTGNELFVVGGMIACMTNEASPIYVRTTEPGSTESASLTDSWLIEEFGAYPMDRPTDQHLSVMDHIVASSRTTSEGEPYRIKRELIEFGEQATLPFMANYEGKTDKGKFRRLKVHVVSPLEEQGLVRVEKVGTRRRVFVTGDGRNMLRAFRHRLR